MDHMYLRINNVTEQDKAGIRMFLNNGEDSYDEFNSSLEMFAMEEAEYNIQRFFHTENEHRKDNELYTTEYIDSFIKENAKILGKELAGTNDIIDVSFIQDITTDFVCEILRKVTGGNNNETGTSGEGM